MERRGTGRPWLDQKVWSRCGSEREMEIVREREREYGEATMRKSSARYANQQKKKAKKMMHEPSSAAHRPRVGTFGGLATFSRGPRSVTPQVVLSAGLEQRQPSAGKPYLPLSAAKCRGPAQGYRASGVGWAGLLSVPTTSVLGTFYDIPSRFFPVLGTF